MNTQGNKAEIQFSATMTLDLNGEDPELMAERIERSVYDVTFGNGAVTGDTAAEVYEHAFDVVLLSPHAANIDEDQLAEWLSMQLESGAIPLEGVAKLMAKYALANPAELRNELAEQMSVAPTVPH